MTDYEHSNQSDVDVFRDALISSAKLIFHNLIYLHTYNLQKVVEKRKYFERKLLLIKKPKLSIINSWIQFVIFFNKVEILHLC